MLRPATFKLLVLFLWVYCGALASPAVAGPFVAFSLKEAQRLAQAGGTDTRMQSLGGITRIAGMVHDVGNGDLIIVGQANNGEEPLSLDDLVVALRVQLVYNTWPKVSIDKTADTPKTGKQQVRFEGGLENTHFGRRMLEADVILKRLALGALPGQIWGVTSYFARSADSLRRGETGEDRVGSQFWFELLVANLAGREGVFAIKELRIAVKTRVLNAVINGQRVTDLSQVQDKIGDRFSQEMTANLTDIGANYPELARIRPMFDMVGLALGIQQASLQHLVEYWLKQYQVPPQETPKDYDLIVQKEEIPLTGRVRVLTIDGGVALKALMIRLRDGDITALKEIVLNSRPQKQALSWQVPISGWHLPGEEEAAAGAAMPTEAMARDDAGCYIDRQITTPGKVLPAAADSLPRQLTGSASSGAQLPQITMADRLPPQMQSNRVGGVMLKGTAKVAGGGGQVDLSQGNFSLVVDGQNAQLAPETFRKFVTALWGVYFSEQDPGISIDPIAPGAKKQMVRYIGKVINSDLGRVMRDADYLMKKWAVGTERPNLPGFKDVDSLTVRHGLRYLGASRRFWFVPEDMRFKRGDDLLLFDQGRMTVKTEYILQNKGQKAEPADLAFAKFFTTHYQEIAARYPVYQELFEYAKMVSLAKYLKDQGVPLQWWLLAHKDLVITEDSPGTVDALAKGSEHYKGLYIEGGVNLGTEGHYVYDQQAVSAINAALQKYQTTSPQGTSMAPARDLRTAPANPYSFAVGKDNYTVLPQHSLTSGKDYRGIRYQTDLALRQGGKPGLEVVRYFNPRHRESGEFGEGWHLLVPYRIKPTGSDQQVFLNAMIPKKMTVVNLLNGDEEVLTFSTDRYSIAGYVPAQLAKSQVVGLFIMSDASYRLADKLGNEFWFNQAGFLTEMIFGKNQRFHLDYRNNLTDSLEQAPYQVQAEPGEPVQFLNALVPSKVKIVDLVHGGSETLTFQKTGKVAGYVPAAESQSKFRLLALMSDGSFQLLDQAGNETDFSTAGQFQQLNLPAKQQMVKAISHGQQKITFNYTLSANGRACIASTHWEKGKGNKPVCVARYEYDRGGRLARVSNPDRQVADAGATGYLAYSPQ